MRWSMKISVGRDCCFCCRFPVGSRGLIFSLSVFGFVRFVYGSLFVGFIHSCRFRRFHQIACAAGPAADSIHSRMVLVHDRVKHIAALDKRARKPRRLGLLSLCLVTSYVIIPMLACEGWREVAKKSHIFCRVVFCDETRNILTLKPYPAPAEMIIPTE